MEMLGTVRSTLNVIVSVLLRFPNVSFARIRKVWVSSASVLVSRVAFQKFPAPFDAVKRIVLLLLVMLKIMVSNAEVVSVMVVLSVRVCVEWLLLFMVLLIVTRGALLSMVIVLFVLRPNVSAV